MEEDYRSASKRFWQTVRRLRRGKQYSANTVYSAGGELLTSTGDIVGRWKKYFEDLLNPTDLPSSEEAEAGDSEVDSSITQAEVTEVVRKLLSGKAPGGVDEIRPEYLKSLDVCGAVLADTPLQHCMEVGDKRDHTSQPSREGLRHQGTGEENSAYSRRPSDSGGTMRFSSQAWNTGPALYPPQGAGGFMGVCPTSPHVLCGSGEGIRPCPSWYSVGVAPCEYGVQGPLLRAVRSLYDRSRSLVRIAGRFLGVVARGRRESRFGNHRISSLLFADDVVLLASSSQDLQHVLERFAAECEAAGMRISTSKSEAMVLDRKRVACPLRVEWRGPASSGGVQVSRGLVHE
ncbi:hypothetical protein L3Q82_022982 [Scortum barcoo]|uniref:Uncharacterized protein n=1 Tax=Scortum barcoo TaxID=214431 RepID=A0ACB8WXE8_9TELE|nr:hypothetical protein L3Q82_022982 [Scortum barcoo]